MSKPRGNNGSSAPGPAGLACPVPVSIQDTVTMAHGSGGRLTRELIENVFRSGFSNRYLDAMHDGAIVPAGNCRIAMSTDSYVISPLFFPGGDIGSLSVHGTVNDLCMCGARPAFLSVAMIIEEGLPVDELRRVVASMQEAAARSGVALVTGDTKVVDRGKGDRLFITTTGIGLVDAGVDVSPKRAAPGDAVILSGGIAEHGIAVMSVREGLEFGTGILSDSAPLDGLVSAMLGTGADIHVLRDPTRGGIASALNEIAADAGVGIGISEKSIPVREDVRAACEILGMDPLYVANEGKLLAFVPRENSGPVLSAMHRHPLGRRATVIGEVISDHPGIVVMETTIGGSRVVDMLSGDQLPRIC